MPELNTIKDLSASLKARTFPSITIWNRLEGRPVAEKFDRALKAEVRDALWMLTKQWQLGEFQGDDAGSPVFAKLHVGTTRLRKFQPGQHAVEPFDDAVPLEAEVERRPLAFKMGATDIALDLRLLMGRQWLKLMRSIPGNFSHAFATKYRITAPDPAQPADGPICAHPEVWSAFAATTGRRMDGFKLYEDLTSTPVRHAHTHIGGLAGQIAAVEKLEERFVAWFERLFFQPSATGEDAWEPSRLEYQFSCAAPEATGEKVLHAEEYYHGHLDWYNFDLDPQARVLGDPAAPDPLAPGGDTQTLIPTPISFQGMPNTRWWAFEDHRTNFGDVKPDTTDLPKLLLIEFGLVFANDWFLIPHKLDAGSLARVRGLAVTNVFGERTWIDAAGRGPDDAWQRWAMFLLNFQGQGNEAADTGLVLLPTAPKVQESKPIEEVILIRDEVANMVWGVEKTIPLPTGVGKSGSEAAIDTRNFLQRNLPPSSPPPPPAAPIRYQLMNTVPEEWIPFIPVHVEGDNRATQLQRAALPRVFEGESKSKKIRPRTQLLREGLDAKAAYFIHEEEVPRAGVRVTQSFQRTRWRDGRVWLWLGVRKQTGRGEGSSGLAFDQIVNEKPAQ